MPDPLKVTGDKMNNFLTEAEIKRQAAVHEMLQALDKYPVEPREWVRVIGRALEHLNDQGITLANATDIVRANNRRKPVGG